jgi:SnoaL-like domain
MKYFELATQADTDAYFAQFADDAVVEDEGKERHGIAEIRAWRTEVPPVRYDVQNIERDGSRTHAQVEVSGTFPGSPVTLSFDFQYTDDDRISVLRIRG